MPYSRKSLVLSQLKEIAKNDNRPHPLSRDTVSIPQERMPTVNPVSHGDLLVVNNSFLPAGSAADLWLLQVEEDSMLLAKVKPYNLLQGVSVPVVKKVVRIVKDYFRNYGVCRDENLLHRLRKDFHEQFQTWASLSHPNLAAIHFVDSLEFTLFQEYCENGDLREYIKQVSSEVEYIGIIKDILYGIVYLHSREDPIAHGWINPGKIYMKGKTAKLGEFGLAQLVSEFPNLVPSISVAGMTRWTCPEYFNEREPGLSTTLGDVWSFGCTIFELTTGLIPYHQSKYDTQVLARIMAGDPPGDIKTQPPTSGQTLSVDYIELMQRLIAQCWLPVTERLSSQDLLRQFNQEARKLENFVPVLITALMPVNEIFKYLIHYGIVDMTPNLKPLSIDSQPFQSSGLEVYVGYLDNNTKVAVKLARLPGNMVRADGSNPLMAHELCVWSKCNHPNVLPLTGAIIFHGGIASVSPWAENGNVSNYLKMKKDMSIVARLGICIQIAEAISYLHGIGIIHGDVKGPNVLISGDGIPRITGFRQAIIAHPDSDLCFESFDSECTLHWAPPEIVTEDAGRTTHSDIYSLGMTILEVITGCPPWGNMRDYRVVTMMILGERPNRPNDHIPSGNEWADLTWDLLMRCWNQNPTERPTAAEVRDELKDILKESKN
ncbi:Serine/threonine-protein kinase dst1 OS=Dictyostelium discoideum GN=dst1 PE=3 SV=1 [Rhizoctonia solani AG-1 IB]|uniref:Serine/threonine-protein kinase dst1 n=1 Tax=Thanatephorus cucumeris (strain AG1-IB / isolate 7/3/14) TaxID=1108050 RepID=A0A0B7F6A8_THACB|nr:Serine/threonine-protein kinase dst1 OS=Dictyostelium discoideum GN=dst1 PE=3 SV=1 [Rhizoctonia solani AG-1 IB]